MKKVLLAASAALVALSVSFGAPANATGLFPGLEISGGASYCAGYAIYNTGNTTPGTLPTPNVCAVTTPAGPANPTGYEYLPADTYGMNQGTPDQGVAPASVGIAASALGFGPMKVVTTTGNLTIPNNTPNYVINVSDTASATITLPATPQPWQIQRITVTVATGASGSVALAANSNQSMLPSSITVAGNSVTGHAAVIWNPNTSTWYQI